MSGFVVSAYERGLWLTCPSMLQSLDLSISRPKRCFKRARSHSVLSHGSEAQGTQVGAESQEILNWLETSWAAGRRLDLKAWTFEMNWNKLSVTVALPGTFLTWTNTRSCFREFYLTRLLCTCSQMPSSMNKNYLLRSSPGWCLVQNK